MVTPSASYVISSPLISGESASTTASETGVESVLFSFEQEMTKMVRAKYNFYTKQNQDYADTVQKAAQIQAAKDKDIVNKIGVTADDVASTTTQGGGGGIASSGMTGAQAAGMGGGSRQATSAGSTKSGRTDGGWGWAKGGFVRGSYFNGGIVSLRRR